MLEIIALIFLTKNIGNLAERKGLKKGTWKLYTVLAWFGAELAIGLPLVLMMPDNLYTVMLLAWGGAITSYFVIKSNLDKRPDAGLEHDIEQIGVEDLKPPRQY